MSSEGELLWTKQFTATPTSKDDYVYGMRPTPDGGAIIAGVSYEPEVIPGTNWYNNSIWSVKMDGDGNIYFPLELHHTFQDTLIHTTDTLTLPPYEAIYGTPCYDYHWSGWGPAGDYLSGLSEGYFHATTPGTYTLTLTVEDQGGEEAQATFTIEVLGPDSIAELEAWTIYPNPVQDRLHLPPVNATHIRIFDISGREMLTLPYAEVVSVSKLTPGAYLLGIYDHQVQLGARRLVVE